MSETKELVQFNHEQIDLLKRNLAKDFTDDEFALFVQVCKKTQLDPFTRQIYAMKQKNGKVSFVSSIDGLRLIAERSGKYAGQVGPLWCDSDGVWRDVWLGTNLPSAAKVGVCRSDFKEPLWGVARFDAYKQEYNGKLNFTWEKMPDIMIAKCAEALALRKAFPQELSGLYTNDELAQDTPHAATPAKSFDSIPKAVMDKARLMGNGQTISVTNLAKSINEINDWPPPKEEFAEAAQAWPETNPDVTIANIAGSAQYKVEFGKYLGKSLEEMGPAQVQSYVDWWSRKLKEDGKEAQGKVRDFLTHANLFLKANPDDGRGDSIPF